MRCFFNFILVIFILFAVVSCGSSPPSPAEVALVGTWTSESDPKVFIFTSDLSYVIEDPSQGRITGAYRALGSQTELKENRFMLRGVSFSIKFLSLSEGFVIDYGDGFTSKSVFRRKIQR